MWSLVIAVRLKKAQEKFQSLIIELIESARRKRKLGSKRFSLNSKTLYGRNGGIDAPPPHGRGLISGISKENLEKLLSQLDRDLKLNRKWAARRFMKNFIGAQFDSGEEIYWVETTPMNIPQADKLQKLFPNALFINMIRDPRDVIASLLTKNWGPTTALEGLDWIEKRLLAGHAALSKIQADKKITIALEDLVITNRGSSYENLLNFLKISDEPAMQSFFTDSMTPDAATSGRWRSEIDSAEFNAGYEAMKARLKASGL